jgi:hypothetical protein
LAAAGVLGFKLMSATTSYDSNLIRVSVTTPPPPPAPAPSRPPPPPSPSSSSSSSIVRINSRAFNPSVSSSIANGPDDCNAPPKRSQYLADCSKALHSVPKWLEREGVEGNGMFKKNVK